MSKNVKEFYPNDIVYRFDKNKKIVFGIVSDSYTNEQSSDMSDYQLEKGEIRVKWNNKSDERFCKQEKVTLAARNILPGEVVRKIENDKDTQIGYCKSVKKTFTVQIVGTDKVIENVSLKRLHNLCPYTVDDFVCFKSKCGRIDGVDQRITMTSKCGSVVQVLTSLNSELEEYWLLDKYKTSFEGFYPSQELVGIPSSLEQPIWINKTKTMKKNMIRNQKFTIQSVKDTVVEVTWFGETTDPICSDIQGEELKKLKVLERSFEFLDTKKMLKINSSDHILKKRDWIQKLTTQYKLDRTRTKSECENKSISESKVKDSSVSSDNSKDESTGLDDEEWITEEEDEEEEVPSENSAKEKIRRMDYQPRRDEQLPGKNVAVEVLLMDAYATVVWQNGTQEANIPTTELYIPISSDDHEFFPGEWVTPNDKVTYPIGKYGVVQYANYSERVATVKWFEFDEIEKIQSEISSSEMSVYDLKKHPRFLFTPGTVVQAKPMKDYKLGRTIDSSPAGFIAVRWIDGIEENCSPHNILPISEETDYYLSNDEDSDEKGQLSWETESVESFTGGDITEETALQNIAARLDFIRNRIIYFKEAFKKHIMQDNLLTLRDLLLVYDNSSYLDKLLGTSFFSIKSKHFQLLLSQAKEKAKLADVEFRGRLFANDNLFPSTAKMKIAEKENLQKVLRIENKVNAQMEKQTDNAISDESQVSHNNLCIELLSMLKIRMDLVYAEILSKIGGDQALTIITQASEAQAEPTVRMPLPNMPITPEDSFSSISSPNSTALSETYESESYCALDEAPAAHHFLGNKFEPTDKRSFLKVIHKEYSLLRESLPSGVWVRSFGNRTDLLSVMIEGPANTPYEDGLFLFDIQLSADYPRSPPLVHYISYSTERLNPNLYVEGKVCVSLLGTWMGKGTEVWGPNSTLLQLIVSIQGLILVSEPYYNEAGYEKQTATQQGCENSRTYNELVILRLVQSMTEMLLSPPEVFKPIVFNHFCEKSKKFCERLEKYCLDSNPLKPEFPLLPVSKGLKLSLNSALKDFEKTCKLVLKRSN